MKRKSKRIYESLITVSGVTINNECPECEGDGHFLEDNTHARGGTMNPYLCDYCDGKGIIDESKVSDIKFDSEGEPVIIYKDIKGDEPYDSNRK